MIIRLLQSILTILGVSIVVFVLVRVVPGDPISMMLPPGATAEDILKLKVLYGLDKSIPTQYFIWLQDALIGDWGRSITFRVPVIDMVLERLPATLELAFMALFFALLLGTSLSIASIYGRQTPVEYLLDFIKSLLLSIPDFLWALLFVLLFAVALGGTLPVSGRIDQSLSLDFNTNFYLLESLLTFRFDLSASIMRHMLLPALSLSLPLSAIIAHVLKHAILEIMPKDYVTLARVKGFSFWYILWKEIIKNAAIPSLTLIAVQFTFLIGGTVIIEKLFAYPGIGNLSIDAVINRDLPLIQGLVICFSILFVSINLLVDYSYYWLNPKLRDAKYD